jgi:hypothetical protein
MIDHRAAQRAAARFRIQAAAASAGRVLRIRAALRREVQDAVTAGEGELSGLGPVASIFISPRASPC